MTFLLRPLASHPSCCQLYAHCRNCLLRNLLRLSSVAVPVSCDNAANHRRTKQSDTQLSPVTKRSVAALHHNANIQRSTHSGLLTTKAGLRLPIVNFKPTAARAYGRLRPNVPWLTLSPKAIVEASPLYIQPYLRLIRLDRPIGTWLLFLPSAWSITLATPSGQLPDVGLLTVFALGAFMMRSAGCTINDMWDKDFDIHVERTKDRPIACGEISRLKAFVFLGLPLSVSLAMLLTLNSNTVMLGIIAMLPVIVYPLMKRITYWPQAFLGITFNYGALMGWSAVRGCLEWSVVPLYLSCFAWTILYDSIYAFQDKEFDSQIGVKSTAQRFADHPQLWMSAFASVMTCGLASTGWICNQPWPYYLGVGLFAAHLGHQICTVDVNDPKSCGQKFRSNRNIGLIFWALLLASSMYSYNKHAKQEAKDNSLPGHENCVVQSVQ